MKNSIFFIILFSTAVLSHGCMDDKFETSTEGRLNVFLTGLSIDFASEMREINLQKFKYLSGDKNNLENALTKFSAFIFSAKQRNTVSDWQSNLSGIKDRYLKRQVELLAKMYLINSIEFHKNILEKRYQALQNLASIRIPTIDGSMSIAQVRNRIFSSSNVDRSGYMQELKPKTALMRERLIELIKSRNDAAKKAGFEDYSALILYVEEIKPEMLDALLTELEASTRQLYKEFLIKKAGGIAVNYADLPGLFGGNKWEKNEFKNIEKLSETATQAFKRIGVYSSGKIEALKSASATVSNGFTVSIPGDYKIVMADSPAAEFSWDFIYYYSLAVYYNNLRDSKTILSGFSNVLGASSRIQRNMTGTLISSALQKTNTDKNRNIFKTDPAYRLYRLRADLMKADFEWTLYSDPSMDPEALFRNLAEKYLMVSVPSELTSDWATDYNLLENPFEYAMKIAGETAGWQLSFSLSEILKPAQQNAKQTGEWFKAVLFRYGELYSWHKKLMDITGKTLQADEILKSINSMPQ